MTGRIAASLIYESLIEYSLMVGGGGEIVEKVRPIFEVLAPALRFIAGG
jgi:6-phosphogluconate dehydrogenase (decarboxylating)